MANRTTHRRTAATTGIQQTNGIIKRLIDAYNAELETLMNYLACAASLDGIRAERIRDELLADVNTELGHAKQLAARIRTLGGVVPGSQRLNWKQSFLQPPKDSTDVISVIKGVIEAEEQAIEMYQGIIEATNGVDYVTQDLAITILADEQGHRREFAGFLKEYERSK